MPGCYKCLWPELDLPVFNVSVNTIDMSIQLGKGDITPITLTMATCIDSMYLYKCTNIQQGLMAYHK